MLLSLKVWQKMRDNSQNICHDLYSVSGWKVIKSFANLYLFRVDSIAHHANPDMHLTSSENVHKYGNVKGHREVRKILALNMQLVLMS